MLRWKQKFLENRLKQGRILYTDNRVVDFQEKDGNYTAVISGNQVYNVRISVADEKIKRMSCGCPVSRMGNSCEHMAAVLWAREAKIFADLEGVPEKSIKDEWKKELQETKEREINRASSRVNRSKETKSRQQEKEEQAEKQRIIEAARKAYEEEQREKARLEAEERERLRIEQEKQKEEEAEKERKRLEREKRKQEKAAKDAENKRKIAEARAAEAAKRKAEEERREKIREQKALEAQRKAEKKRQEEEAARTAALKREEEIRKQAEEEQKQQKKREEEERRRKRAEQKEAEERKKVIEAMQKNAAEKIRLQKQKEQERTEKYVLLGDSWNSDSEENDKKYASIDDMAAYRYYDAVKIRSSVNMSQEQIQKGQNLIQKGKIQIKDMNTGYLEGRDDVIGQIEAVGKYRTEEFPVIVQFSKDKIINTRCNCPNCRQWYYKWSYSDMCDYKSGVISYLTGYLSEHNFGDATDYPTLSFMKMYRKTRTAERKYENNQKQLVSQKLTPRLLKKDGTLTLAFKFGENKMFVVKDLEKFYRQVSDREEGTYGSNTVIAHNQEAFDEASGKWFRLLKQIIQEEQSVKGKIENSGYYHNSDISIGNSVDLFGWRLDAVFERLKEGTIEYEDWDRDPKWKTTMKYGELKPKINLIISPNPNKKGSIFHGIHVKGNIPPFFEGTDTAYYLENNILSRVEPEYYKKVEPLKNISEDGLLKLEVGRNMLSEFYYRVLPDLREIVNVTEMNADRIRSYLLPEARFFFYLDTYADRIGAEAEVRYGDRVFNLFDYINKERAAEIEDYRDAEGEQRALDILIQYLDCYDDIADILHNNGDEDKAYRLYAYGLDALNSIGEVHCTRQFMELRKMKKVSVSVGVRVSEGMLNLDILTRDITDQELLDILKSYRQKKKYYRLKDGSFVNLEDPSLETITEMVDVLHLSKEELKKKNISLPLYRALYLDKILAENEELYEDRDTAIRRMASQFQTIENTEYDVPKSLKKIMRSYQKDGFKWLKTLESWGFGGILADEMGLGKTLQMISVLLSAKEGGKKGTSLIVCPASLVYNWEEEFHRFAPELQVRTVTGTQAERNAIISEMDADVLVTSYDLLKRDIISYDGKEFLFEVLDEAQYIKTHTTAAAKSVKSIKSKVRFALTGTPVENRLSELWSIFDYLMPGFLYGYDTFRKEYELPIVKNEEEVVMQRLQRLTGPFILRRRKDEVLKDLPEKLEEVRYVKMEEKQQHLYDGQLIQIKNEISGQSDQEFNQNKIKILASLTRLRQLCCDPSLCLENYHGEAAKTEACLELIQGAIDGGHRMLVFSQFTSMLDILRARLEKEGITYFLLTGSTSKEERADLVQRFNEGDVPVFLISLKAGGVGLNLTGADLVIHYDPWWNIAAQNQATDRVHRIGQKKKVTVYKLITKGTIEEKILQLQEKKKALADQILSGEGGQLGSLSKEEIMEILEDR